jgi:hypothetical protein
MVFPMDVAVSQGVEVVTPITGVEPDVPGKIWLVSLKITCCDGLVPPLYANWVEGGLANRTWVPAAVTKSATLTGVFPLGVATVMVAV